MNPAKFHAIHRDKNIENYFLFDVLVTVDHVDDSRYFGWIHCVFTLPSWPLPSVPRRPVRPAHDQIAQMPTRATRVVGRRLLSGESRDCAPLRRLPIPTRLCTTGSTELSVFYNPVNISGRQLDVKAAAMAWRGLRRGGGRMWPARLDRPGGRCSDFHVRLGRPTAAACP